jgi:hypothetical protein
LTAASHRGASRHDTAPRLASRRFAPYRIAPHCNASHRFVFAPRRFTAPRDAPLRDAPHRPATQRNLLTNVKRRNIVFQLSPETDQIVRYLQQFPKGELIRYPELSRVAGTKITAATPKLTYARRILLNQHAQAWASVRPNVGVRRMDDREIAERMDSWFLAGARRKLRRGGRHADVVEVEELSIEEQAKFAVSCIQRELGLSSLSKTTRDRIGKIARGSSNDLPEFNVVEWAISLSPKRKGATV